MSTPMTPSPTNTMGTKTSCFDPFLEANSPIADQYQPVVAASGTRNVLCSLILVLDMFEKYR